MVRALRLLGAVTMACASVPVLGVASAHADTSITLPASNAAYFYSAGVDKPDASPAAPPNVTSEFLDGVSPGHLAVAAAGGQEDKVSFLYFDVFALPEGATISKAVVTMKLIPNTPPNDLSYQAAPANVVACKAGDKGFSGDDGTGLSKNAPERLCSAFSAKGTAKDATTWQWDVTGLATAWLAGANDGLAFTRGEDVASSFQVVFDAASTAKIAIEYAAPLTEEPEIVPELPVDPGVDVGGLTPDPGVVAPPVDLGGGFAPDPGVVAPEVPAPAAGAPAAPAPTTVATRPIALSTSLVPTGGFWLAGLAIAALLVLVSLVQGDSRVPTAAGSRSRLAQALAARERHGAAPLRTRHV